jgi:aryl-alcohol dehydrogenase-like predicted oxidoreductase
VFSTIQIPYHLLNPSAGETMPADFGETDYGNLIADCVKQSMGVFTIRVFAAGALLGNAPSAHTKKTPFFPLALYERDSALAKRLHAEIDSGMGMQELALRFALSHTGVTSAILGFGDPSHVDEAVSAMSKGALPAELLQRIHELRNKLANH